MAKQDESKVSGYPRIEKLVESEDFDALNKSFGTSYQELQKIAKQKNGLGKGKAAKKAMRTYELVMDLFKELLKLKYQMLDAAKQQGDSNK